MASTYPGGIEDCDRFRELIDLFEENEQRNYYYIRAQETVEEEFGDQWYKSDELVLGGPMLLLYAWNFAAAETKQIDKDEVQQLLEKHHSQIEQVRDISLVEADLHEGGTTYETVRAVFPSFKEYFGQTGAAKVLSLLNPSLFVMWDEDIRTRKSRSQNDPPGELREDRGVYFHIKDSDYTLHNNTSEFGRDFRDYIVYLRYCQDILDEIQDCPLFEQNDTPPAKLLDEALYAFYQIEHS